MSTEKKLLLVVFEPDPMPSARELREQFATSYPLFVDMAAVEFKCWWVDETAGQWGGFYVFRSQEELDAYLVSDHLRKVAPAKYGCVPTCRVMEPGLILSKKIITGADGSWLDQEN